MSSGETGETAEPVVLRYAATGADSSRMPWYIPLSLAVTGVLAIAMVIPSFTHSHGCGAVSMTRSRVARGGPIGCALALSQVYFAGLLAEEL